MSGFTDMQAVLDKGKIQYTIQQSGRKAGPWKQHPRNSADPLNSHMLQKGPCSGENCVQHIVLAADNYTKNSRVGGYTGFFTVFHFRRSGTLLYVDIWE